MGLIHRSGAACVMTSVPSLCCAVGVGSLYVFSRNGLCLDVSIGAVRLNRMTSFFTAGIVHICARVYLRYVLAYFPSIYGVI